MESRSGGDNDAQPPQPPPIPKRFSVSISSVADDIEEAALNTDIAAATRRIEGNEDEILRDLRRSSLIVDVPADDDDEDSGLGMDQENNGANSSSRRNSIASAKRRDSMGSESVVTVSEVMNNENNEDSPNEEDGAAQNADRRSSLTKRLSEVFNNSASSIKNVMEQIGKEYDSDFDDDDDSAKKKEKQAEAAVTAEVAVPQTNERQPVRRRLSGLSGISGLSGMTGLFTSQSSVNDNDSEDDDEEIQVDFSKIEIMHVDDTLEPDVDNRSNPFMKDLTIDVANMDDDDIHINDGAGDDYGKQVNRGVDAAIPHSDNDFNKRYDHGKFTGMVITPDHDFDYNMHLIKDKFGKMLLCGVLCVCILGTFAFVMSVTNFGGIDTGRYPTVDPPIAYLDVTLPREIDVHFADWKLHEHEHDHALDHAAERRNDVPIFWSIPLTGNEVIEEYLGGCLGLTQASEVGIIGNVDDEDDASLQEVNVHGLSYINVNLRTRHGIEHATRMHLIDDHKNGDLSLTPDVLHTPLLYESAQLFEDPNENQGKIFTILRDPMERAVALYQQIVTSKSYTKSAAGGGHMKNNGEGDFGSNIMTIADYAQSQYVENNWLTRTLCNKPTGRLTEDDLKVAKEIIRRKVLVGLYDNVPLALSYFKHKFDWSNEKNNKHHLNQQRREMQRDQQQLKRRSLVTKVKNGSDFTKDDNYYFSHCTAIGVEEALKKESEGWLWMKSQQYSEQRQDQQQELLVEGSFAWTLLKRENEFDNVLYKYAKTVHEYQFSSYHHRHRGMSN